MTTIEALNWRYATKNFDATRKLNSAQLELLKQAFNLTPTSYGLQPLKMVIIGSKELKDALLPHSYGQKQVQQASHLLVLCIERIIDRGFITRYFERVREVRSTPESILKPYREFLWSFFEKKSEGEIREWATRQVYLALGNLLTVCALEGIDSCPMEGFEPEAYDRILGLEQEGLRSVLVLPVGFRAEDDFFASLEKVRRPLEDSVLEK